MRWLSSARASGVEALETDRRRRARGGARPRAGRRRGRPRRARTQGRPPSRATPSTRATRRRSTRSTAWLASPYRALGIYIGGANRACSNTQLSPTWTAGAVATGLEPDPALRRAAGAVRRPVAASRRSRRRIAASQGTAAADDAADDAAALGLPPRQPDLLRHGGLRAQQPGVQRRPSRRSSPAWVNELHALGYLAGRLRQRRLDDPRPAGAHDDRLLARRRLDRRLERRRERVRQPVRLGHALDEPPAAPPVPRRRTTRPGAASRSTSTRATSTRAVVGSTGSRADARRRPPRSPLVGESAAGSVTAVDGLVGVSWPAGAFQQSVVVSLTPALPTAARRRASASGGYGVQLQVQQTATRAAAKRLRAPAHDPHPAARRTALAPMTSTDGATWQPLQPLFSGDAAEGRAGRLHAQRRRLVRHRDDHRRLLRPAARDARGRRRPPALTGHFSHGQLVLSLAEVDRRRAAPPSPTR